MKEKVIKVINISNLLISMGMLFFPIDYLYVHFKEFIFLLIDIALILLNYFFVNKKKIILSLIVIVIFTFSNYCIFILKEVSYFTIYWKLNLILCFIPKTICMCGSLKLNKQNIIFIFILIYSTITVKVLFFPLYYYFEGNKNDMEDIRNFDLDDRYRVVGRHKLKRDNPELFPVEKINIISDILVKSSWISEHYPNFVMDSSLLSSEYIAKNIKYDFSLLQYYNFVKVDVYKLCIHSEGQQIEIYIPLGEYIMFEEGLDVFMKYTSYIPKLTSLYCYSDLFVPFYDKEWYVSNIKH